MLIGQAQIRSLLEYGIIGSTRNYYTVALFHHAERFLHTQEICEYDQRKELPSACNNITADQPQIKCRSDFELVFAYDDQRMAIPLKCVSVFIRDDNTALLSNAEDVCRNLDIICIGPTDKPGTSKVSISIATIKENSVEALLTR